MLHSFGILLLAALAGDAVLLGPGDTIVVRALHVNEFPERPVRIDETGRVQLPLLGTVEAAGLTTQGLAAKLAGSLERFVREPQVWVELADRKSRPVSVLGAVKSPGVYQIEGARRLLDILSLAGGLEPEAGGAVNVTRGDSTFSVKFAGLLDGAPAANPLIQPNDLVTVPRAKLVYVMGDVRKAGGFALRDEERMTVLQALALAEGTTATAATRHARILRPAPGELKPREIAVNVQSILAGKAADVPLEAKDILFIPGSASKSASLKVTEALMQMAVGVVVWRR